MDLGDVCLVVVFVFQKSVEGVGNVLDFHWDIAVFQVHFVLEQMGELIEVFVLEDWGSDGPVLCLFHEVSHFRAESLMLNLSSGSFSNDLQLQGYSLEF